MLGLYDPNDETEVTADASSYGLGAVLRQCKPGQEFRVIVYACRRLAETEIHYAQIEKEALALAWACQKLRDYLCGKHFKLPTDHKPLVPILSENAIDDLTPRLQRLRMRMLRYGFDVSYVPGRESTAAEALSRAPLRQAPSSDLDEEVEFSMSRRHIQWHPLP